MPYKLERDSRGHVRFTSLAWGRTPAKLDKRREKRKRNAVKAARRRNRG
jgi:hypothetical protein